MKGGADQQLDRLAGRESEDAIVRPGEAVKARRPIGKDDSLVHSESADGDTGVAAGCRARRARRLTRREEELRNDVQSKNVTARVPPAQLNGPFPPLSFTTRGNFYNFIPTVK